MKTTTSLALFLAAALSAPVSPGGENLDPALQTVVRTQKDGALSQQRVEALDDEGLGLLAEYRKVNEELDDLRTYNAQMERLVADQSRELTERDQALSEIETTKRRILPLLLHMVEVLEQFVSMDLPFLSDERSLRVAHLKRLMDDADTPLSEKYRRVMEAYQVEVQYGHTIEAYQGELRDRGSTRTVEFLRLGRVGLYYLSLDGKHSGHWDRSSGSWVTLDGSYRGSIAKAIRVARKQTAPDLIRLPVPAPEVPR